MLIDGQSWVKSITGGQSWVKSIAVMSQMKGVEHLCIYQTRLKLHKYCNCTKGSVLVNSTIVFIGPPLGNTVEVRIWREYSVVKLH